MRADSGRLRLVGSPEEPTLDTTAAPASPGRRLKELRVRRGMSLEQLSAATKVPVASLRRIEADAYDELPGPVFVRGFLRCCARALSADPRCLLEPYEDLGAAGGLGGEPAGSTKETAGPAGPRRPMPGTGRPPAAGRATGRWAAARWRLETANMALWTVIVLFLLLIVSAAYQLGAAGAGS